MQKLAQMIGFSNFAERGFQFPLPVQELIPQNNFNLI
jgi:hypothetical protein